MTADTKTSSPGGKSRHRTRHSLERKLEAVAMSQNSGLPVRVVAKKLGISERTLQNWRVPSTHARLKAAARQLSSAELSLHTKRAPVEISRTSPTDSWQIDFHAENLTVRTPAGSSARQVLELIHLVRSASPGSGTV